MGLPNNLLTTAGALSRRKGRAPELYARGTAATILSTESVCSFCKQNDKFRKNSLSNFPNTSSVSKVNIAPIFSTRSLATTALCMPHFKAGMNTSGYAPLLQELSRHGNGYDFWLLALYA